MEVAPEDEHNLNRALLTLPAQFGFRYSNKADRVLRQHLFYSLAGHRDENVRLLFPNGVPTDSMQPWSLKVAQNVDAAHCSVKGQACGYIFKAGDSTYHCKTCAADDSCVLCARCFEASDHQSHHVYISLTTGNSGCCDCGDHEAWKREVNCSIHTADKTSSTKQGKAKVPLGSYGSQLPSELVEAIRTTVARALDYVCDVLSCSPEQLRQAKTEESVMEDDKRSKLGSVYGGEDPESLGGKHEYALVLWNDDKHTIDDVKNQVARACTEKRSVAGVKVEEVQEVGRAVIQYSTNLPNLLSIAQTLEQIRLVATIRSSRDTFREYMCATIVEWIFDLVGCKVGDDAQLLHNVICEELLKPWRVGSLAFNKDIGQGGIDDYEEEDSRKLRRQYQTYMRPFRPAATVVRMAVQDGTMEIIEEDELGVEENGNDDTNTAVDDMEVDMIGPHDDVTEVSEATYAGYPQPPFPPASSFPRSEHEDLHSLTHLAPYAILPKTPLTPAQARKRPKRQARPPGYWLEKPEAYGRSDGCSDPCDDLWQRVRLDFLILYDLRLWRHLRVMLRHLYMTTVVVIPRFKRVLGLRFACLYTALAQLYLIADREPEYSIINLSVQMLTTPSITQEVVERGNFLASLIAILYTFLTTRQVGRPEEVNPRATLDIEGGALTNRRMFHFFMDLRWLFHSQYIQHKMLSEPRYLLQFLDLVKLHQGICPNERAIGEHVEYEIDTWIGASVIMKEINRLCKQVAVSFQRTDVKDYEFHLQNAVRTAAKVTLINTLGFELARFTQSELKSHMQWHLVGPFEDHGKFHSVPNFVVQHSPMSFHHPLHYLLSWLLESAKHLSKEGIRALLEFHEGDIKDPLVLWCSTPALPGMSVDNLVCAMFDPPLRTYVWLAQMKTGMWVRNGATLRHQASGYRSVTYRDVGYQRDIFLMQTGMAICGADNERPGERYLAQIIDRFEANKWVRGDYGTIEGFEDAQQLDVFEDMIHLLVILLSERGDLISENQHQWSMQHEIIQALCFKPLSYSDLSSKVTDRVGQSDDYDEILESMTVFHPPEGLSDFGTFELKPEYILSVDPYFAHYSKNQREEAEDLYKRQVARTTGQKVENVVLEPRLPEITTGFFTALPAFTGTPMFVQLICAALNFAATANNDFQGTRIEVFLHLVLHLIVISTLEDCGFIELVVQPVTRLLGERNETVVSILGSCYEVEAFASCRATIKYILAKLEARRPEMLWYILGERYSSIFGVAGTPEASSGSAEDKDKKKREALARQVRVMAKMKEQQNNFLLTQGLEPFGEELDYLSATEETESQRRTWTYPSGTCILCQEETDDHRLYGTFAFLGESNILRATPCKDVEFVKDVLETPEELDRPAARPFMNKDAAERASADRRVISRCFPRTRVQAEGAVATSCGHIMHYHCFELYLHATQRRQFQQVARSHPENLKLKEFICPLCKALGNAFLPIVWKAEECLNENELRTTKSFGEWLNASPRLAKVDLVDYTPTGVPTLLSQEEAWAGRGTSYIQRTFTPELVSSMHDQQPFEGVELPASVQPPVLGYRWRNGTFELQRNRTPAAYESPTQTEQLPRMVELRRAYSRIDDTVKANNLDPHCVTHLPNSFRALSRAFGMTISSMEIAQRGAGDLTSASLLSDIPEQRLMHMRILSETMESLLAIEVLHKPSSSQPIREAIIRQEMMKSQLFGKENELFGGRPRDLAGFLCQDDSFLFFSDWLALTRPDIDETLQYIQLCLWAEVVKTIYIYREVTQQFKSELSSSPAAGTATSQAFQKTVLTMAGPNSITGPQCGLLRTLVHRYAIVFLRKCLILLHIRYGIEFTDTDPSLSEMDRLTNLLHIPKLESLFNLYSYGQSQRLVQITARWLGQLSRVLTQYPPTLPHPCIFELISLPPEYDKLTELATTHPCPTTGKEITDPALCLFCGAIFCSQAVCCKSSEPNRQDPEPSRFVGGCNQHMATCGGSTGIFISIRKCMVLFLHRNRGGCFIPAPYLDRHGETDSMLKKHQRLFLNEQRVERLLREPWLGHGIPTMVARRLDADLNTGGWETL